MAKDLRTYLSTLIERYPDQLKVVEREVQPEFEAAAIVDKMENDPRYPNFPAVVFKKIKGSNMPLILNLHGTYERLALACGAELRTLVADYARLEGSPIPTTPVSSEEAPIHEVVLRDDQIDLTTLLPLLLHNELDAGKYITSAACIVREPNSGRQNMGIFRHQLQGPRQLGFMTNPAHDTSYVLRQLREEGKTLEVALAIGHHPAMLMGAVSQLPGIGGELEVAGSLMAESMQVVQCKTVDLEVPARAEIVIEGIVDTNPEKMQHEGPFGEYPRYYTGSGPMPYVQVTAVTMRHDPIYVDVFNAHAEHTCLGGIPRMGGIYRRVREVVPTVTAVNLPVSGLGRNHLYMSMKKRIEGEPKVAACAALTVDTLLKHIFIVDDDVDVFNEQDVLWCLATRFQADRDLTIMPNFLGGHLNPVTYGYHREEKGPMETKLIFDCTKPAPPIQFPPKCKVPDDALAAVDPGDFLLDYRGDLPLSNGRISVSDRQMPSTVPTG